MGSCAQVIKDCLHARIEMPSNEEVAEFQQAISSKYSTLKDAMGGLRVNVHAAGDKVTQNCFYNGWKYHQ